MKGHTHFDCLKITKITMFGVVRVMKFKFSCFQAIVPPITGPTQQKPDWYWRWIKIVGGDLICFDINSWDDCRPQLISTVKPKLIEILNVDLLPQWINQFLLFWKFVTSYRSCHHTVPGTWVVFNASPPCAWMRQHYPLTRCERTGNLGPTCLVVKKFQESGDTRTSFKSYLLVQSRIFGLLRWGE